MEMVGGGRTKDLRAPSRACVFSCRGLLRETEWIRGSYWSRIAVAGDPERLQRHRYHQRRAETGVSERWQDTNAEERV